MVTEDRLEAIRQRHRGLHYCVGPTGPGLGYREGDCDIAALTENRDALITERNGWADTAAEYLTERDAAEALLVEHHEASNALAIHKAFMSGKGFCPVCAAHRGLDDSGVQALERLEGLL